MKLSEVMDFLGEHGDEPTKATLMKHEACLLKDKNE